MHKVNWRSSLRCSAESSLSSPAQYQYLASWTEEQGWHGKLKPYGPLELLPSAQVLNYGQSIFEGMKVGRQRTQTSRMVVMTIAHRR